MRHVFRFPKSVREGVRQYVRAAVRAVDPRRYRQEGPYVAALAHGLEGVAYSASDAEVVFTSTVVDEKGRGAAESFSGADLAITAVVTSPLASIRKAILIQAKLGTVDRLAARELTELYEQIGQMKNYTRSPQVMEISAEHGVRTPRIISGNRLFELQDYDPMELGDYLVRRVLPTLDGDTRGEFVEAVQDSRLTQLQVLAHLR